MLNSLVKLLHTKIEENLQVICNAYDCKECPYRMENYSTFYLKDGAVYSCGCAYTVLRLVFNANESKEV